MNLKGLQGFTQVITTGTLSAAAKNMNTSESALSRQIMILESVLGVRLFDRSKRNLVPTAEGEAFYSEAEKILTSLDEIPHIIDRIKKEKRQNLKLIVMPRMAPRVAMPSIQEFAEERPETSVVVEVHRRNFIERWLAARQFDLGVGALPGLHSSIETELLCRLPPVVLMPPSHPLAGRRTIRLTDFSEDKFILPPAGSLLARETDRYFEECSMTPRSQIEVSQSVMVCELVAKGMGVAIHDPLVPESFIPSLAMAAIENAPKMKLGLLFPQGSVRSAEVQYLAETLRRHAKRLESEVNDAFLGQTAVRKS